MTSSSFDKTKVHVTINTVITNASRHERMKSEACGTFYVNNQTAVCTFVEKGEAGETKTVVKINPDCVTIHRSGALNMRQQLIANQKTEGFYSTPYGRLSMKTETKNMQFTWDKLKQTGLLHVSYDLWMQADYTGCYNVTIQMEGVQS